MGKQRKTFQVSEFKDYVNEALTRTDDYATKEFKSGLCLALETILHNTGNYEGFHFLDNENCEPDGTGYYDRNYY